MRLATTVNSIAEHARGRIVVTRRTRYWPPVVDSNGLQHNTLSDRPGSCSHDRESNSNRRKCAIPTADDKGRHRVSRAGRRRESDSF